MFVLFGGHLVLCLLLWAVVVWLVVVSFGFALFGLVCGLVVWSFGVDCCGLGVWVW